MPSVNVENVLNVDLLEQQGAIIGSEIHVYRPFNDAFDHNDTLRIPIQDNDGYTVPGDSVLVIEGKAVKTANTAQATPCKWVTNAFAHLLADARYELNNIEVDRVRWPGITSTLKGLVSFSAEERETLAYAGWPRTSDESTLSHLSNATTGAFSVRIPLRCLLGVMEDHRHIVTGVKQELVLTRGSHDHDALITTEAVGSETPSTVVLTKLEWHMPRIRVKAENHIRIQNLILKQVALPMEFMAWDLHIFPNVPSTQGWVWPVKTSSAVECPLYVIVAFQTDRSNKLRANASAYDHLSVTNVKVVINEKEYPYHDLDVDMAAGRLGECFALFRAFHGSYYKAVESASAVTRTDYKDKYPLFVFDCTKHELPTLGKAVDTRIHIGTKTNIPANTTAYALILHKRTFEYIPVNGTVRKVPV